MNRKSDAVPAKRCFFITPIGDVGSPARQRADWVFHYVVEPASNENTLKAERADLMVGSSMIGTNIFRAISESDICIADMTALNPNVLYEMGVRHSLRKPIIHIAQTDTPLPFDTSPHLTYFYDLNDYISMNSLRERIQSEIQIMLEIGYEVSNPFTQALGNIEIIRSGDSKDQVVASLIDRIGALEAKDRLDISSGRTVVSRSDARKAIEGFITSSGFSTKNYNEKTFEEAIDLVKDDEQLLAEVYAALGDAQRPNKDRLLNILYRYYIPF